MAPGFRRSWRWLRVPILLCMGGGCLALVLQLASPRTIDHWVSIWAPLTCLVTDASGTTQVLQGGLAVEILTVTRITWQNLLAGILLVGAAGLLAVALWRWELRRNLALACLVLLAGTAGSLALPLPLRLVAYDTDPRTVGLLNAVGEKTEGLQDVLLTEELWAVIQESWEGPLPMTRQEYREAMHWHTYRDVNSMQAALLGVTASPYHRVDGSPIPAVALLHGRWGVYRFIADRPRLRFLTHALRYQIWYLGGLLLADSQVAALEGPLRPRLQAAWSALLEHPDLPAGLRPLLTEPTEHGAATRPR